jgi:DNA-binding winged helix-turn-helix (wHTH) protein/tetratricopeptide (TPR) repeat protein
MSVRFGPFHLDTENACVWRGDQALHLTPKAFAVLRTLLARPGRLVTKDELWQSVWPGIAVSDAALTVCVREIRRRLDDDTKASRVIETVHRRGYRLIAPTAHDTRTATAAPASAKWLSGSLVGRDADLARLHQHLAQAAAGERQIVFVTGEAGIGKTRVVDAFLTRVAAAGEARIARGVCIEYRGSGEPYLPVLDAIGRLCRGSEAETTLAVLGRYAPTWLEQLPGVASAKVRGGPSPQLLGATRDRMLREMADALEVLSVDRPLVLVLEDLHWSDHATLDLINWLARRRELTRLFLLGTYRPVDVIVRAHPLRAVTGELALRGLAREMPLELLGEADVARYLAVRLPGSEVPVGLVRVIHERTDGNPLFVVALVDALVQQGWLVEVGAGWQLKPGAEDAAARVPRSLQEMVEQLFDALAAEQQRTLEAASAVGREFSVAAAAAGTDEALRLIEDRCAELARRGQFLVAAGIEAWPDGTLAERYRFVHSLYQHVVYERLNPGRRTQLHRRIGARAEAGYREQAGERAAELARHFREGREASRAVAYLRQAADNALQRSAYHESAAYLLQGLAVLLELPHTPERDREELALRIAFGPLLMTMKGVASPEVEQTYTRARALCRELGERSLLVRATWGLSAHHLVCGQPRRAHEIAQELGQLIEDEPDAPLLPLGHLALGSALYYLGELPLSHEHFQKALAAYSPEHRWPAHYGGPQDLRVTCLRNSAWVAWALGYADQAFAAGRAATDLARESSHSPSLTVGLLCMARLHQFRQEVEQTRQHAEAAMKLAGEQGFTQRLAAATILFGWARAMEEDPGGVDTMTRGLADYRATGAVDDLPYWLALLVARRTAAQQVEAAWRDLDEALALVRANGTLVWEAELHRLRAELLSRRGLAHRKLLDEVEDAFDTALKVARRQQAKAFELRAAISLARWWRDHDRQPKARKLLEPVRTWFTEGFDTPDLIEADALLRELGATVPTLKRGRRRSSQRLQPSHLADVPRPQS